MKEKRRKDGWKRKVERIDKRRMNERGRKDEWKRKEERINGRGR